MRTQALAKPEVGDFLSKHYVAVYDKVGTFTVNVGSDGKTPNRNGGNVAAFFCTPSGGVIHAIAGPRTGEAFLAEAKWATAVYAEILKSNRTTLPAVERIVRTAAALKQAHATALELLKDPSANAPAPFIELVRHTPSSVPKLGRLEDAGRKQREQVHRLLKSKAFEPLAMIGPEVYSKVLGETVTTDEVKLNNAPDARQAAQPGKSLLDFYAEGGSARKSIAPAAQPNTKSSAPPRKSAKDARKAGHH